MGIIELVIVFVLALAILIGILWERKERKRPQTIKIHFEDPTSWQHSTKQ